MEITGLICSNNVTSTTTELVAMTLHHHCWFCDNNITSSVPKQRFYGKNRGKSGKKVCSNDLTSSGRLCIVQSIPGMWKLNVFIWNIYNLWFSKKNTFCNIHKFLQNTIKLFKINFKLLIIDGYFELKLIYWKISKICAYLLILNS